MMKTNYYHSRLTKLLIFLICLIFSSANAQSRKEWGSPEKYDRTSFEGKSSVLDKDGYSINYGVARSLGYDQKTKYKPRLFKIPLSIRVDKDTKSISPFNDMPGDPLGSIVYMEDASAVQLSTHIHKDSLSDYRYSIVEEDTLVKIWDAKFNTIDFITPAGADYPYHAYINLVLTNIQNKKTIFKIYKLAKPYEVTTLTLYNKPVTLPKVFEVNLIGRQFKGPKKLKNGEILKISNKLKGIVFNCKKSDHDFARRVVLKFTTEGKHYSSVIDREWGYDGSNRQFAIADSEFNQPGEYEIFVQTNVKPFKDFKAIPMVSVVKFTVAPPPLVFSVREIVLFALGVILVVGLVIFFIRQANKKKQVALTLKADAARNELNNVRSQLNPHFVFNALSGIQNLMNNNAVEQANNYLGKFANLTRQILDDRELISIDDEVKLLRDYLSMEQLRFPFSVEFDGDEDESFRYTEIPTMLLQPFVENAVKHGIAPLKGEGKIIVKLYREQQNVVLLVNDNGKGFQRDEMNKGLGLKLSEKRIALLNKTYSSCPINLKIDSSKGTTVRITLTNWLT